MGASGSTISSNMRGKSVPKSQLDPNFLMLISPKVDMLPDELSFETIKTALAKKTDVFISHNWGSNDSLNQKVTEISEALKSHGFITGCDNDKLAVTMQSKYMEGIDHASCVIVLLTEQYIEKVGGTKEAKGCQQEFKYSSIRKAKQKIIPVILESSVLDTKTWKGEVGKVIGGVSPVDLSGPINDANITLLHDTIMNEIKVQIQKAIEDCYRVTDPRSADNYDLFLSYRTTSDVKHAEKLYDMLTSAGLKVWWDKKTDLPVNNKKAGVCPGLKSSGSCLCIVSSAGIDQPFQKLTKDAAVDSVYLEHRLALELKQKGYLHHIFPIMIGNEIKESANNDGDRYGQFRSSFKEAAACVTSVEEAVKQCLTELGLGAPLSAQPTVYDVSNMLRSCNGYSVGGAPLNTFKNAVRGIVSTLIRPVSLEDYESALHLNKKLAQERDAIKQERDNLLQEQHILQLKYNNLDTHLRAISDRIETAHKNSLMVAKVHGISEKKQIGDKEGTSESKSGKKSEKITENAKSSDGKPSTKAVDKPKDQIDYKQTPKVGEKGSTTTGGGKDTASTAAPAVAATSDKPNNKTNGGDKVVEDKGKAKAVEADKTSIGGKLAKMLERKWMEKKK